MAPANNEKNDSDIKKRIRQRYKGVSEDVLDVIPAKPHEDFYKTDVHKRVAVYARVSTGDPNQTSSYELQKNYFEGFVNKRDNWELVGIYADEGISGTSLKHRENFVRMIEDCGKGMIDIIVTKSVSRFARNIIDCIGYVRQLKAADPPIGVFFETENIFTLEENSEMALSFIATLAQEESHNKSEIMNSSIEMRFSRGIFLTPELLGYDLDEEKNLVINEEEAKTVRLIFFSYLYGYTAQQIADALTTLERLTKRGNNFWSAGTVLEILSNERYCGDVLARKTYTPNYLDHKSKKNKGNRNQYRQKNHHEAIITRDDFFAVQRLIRNAKYGNRGYFPEMKVVNNGFLKGYVIIHPKWAGFSDEDYRTASESVFDGILKKASQPLEVKAEKGSIDLSGYELVRSQFLSSYGQITVSVSRSKMLFNKVAITKLHGEKKIELLVNPVAKMIAVRKARPETRYGIEWAKTSEKGTVSKQVNGSAFIPTLYKIFSWKTDGHYKITGIVHRCGDESVLLFCADEAVLSLDRADIEEGEGIEGIQADADAAASEVRKGRKIIAYPKEWADSFGEKYYENHAKTMSALMDVNSMFLGDEQIAYTVDENITSQIQAANEIKSILEDIGAGDE